MKSLNTNKQKILDLFWKSKSTNRIKSGNRPFSSLLIFYLVILTCCLSCKKLVEVNTPVNNINSKNAFASDPTAIAAVTGIYTSMSTSGTFSAQLTGVSGLVGLSGDDFYLYSGTSSTPAPFYYKNALSNLEPAVGDSFWANIYSTIYLTNAAIEGLTSSNTLTPSIKTQLLGECKFTRAFCYFYLVNLYGDVPLAQASDYSKNALLPRSPATEVWKQIIMDLKDAENSLSNKYLANSLLTTTDERVRPTKWAAAALLARCYLYTKDWSNAGKEASSIINNSSIYSLTSLDGTFLKNSNEAIWQLQPVMAGRNTLDAYYFIITDAGLTGDNSTYLSDGLLNSFELNDERKNHWINNINVGGITYYFPFKYKVNSYDPVNVTSPGSMSEYTMVFRLGEQYLIRAEAEANSNDPNDAAKDLNTIRIRAGLPIYSGATDMASLVNAIIHERRVELFSEWGHRWLDLKRSGTLDAVMGIGGACHAKGGTWASKQQLFPIPLQDMQRDPSLIQNAGY